MSEFQTYYIIPGNPVTAVRLGFDDMEPLRYTKWGGSQTAEHGDWLIAENDGRTARTCKASVFEATYRPTETPGRYVKVGTVEAVVAEHDGSIPTLENRTAYRAGDYIVRNSTGEMYAMTAAEFLARYTPDAPTAPTGIDFGAALAALKAGRRVCRAGWNGKGMWLVLIKPDGAEHVTDAGAFLLQPCIAMKTADGLMQPGWLASQADMLATDWQILD